ncbi:MAG: response regulator transcription factor [Anaerolineaceae bacterium]|nr:response regulator transcription factor [Anaerolineaceae bacterium]
MNERISILIVDDHLIVREGLRLILETTDEFEVVGEAVDGSQGLAMAKEFEPDVILMDLRMPGMDGLTACQHLRDEQPESAVVILTTYNEDEQMVKCLQAGARGYLLKDTAKTPLFNTIRAAARGETLLNPEIMSRVFLQSGKKGQPERNPSKLDLTEREREILAAVSEGKTSKMIAYDLGITERTVKAHLTNIYHKLGVDSRAAAIAEAARRGWI